METVNEDERALALNEVQILKVGRLNNLIVGYWIKRFSV